MFDDNQKNDENILQIKRPPNSYLLFCLEKREDLRNQNPTLSNVEISRMLGELWKKLKESERRPYKDRAKILQDEFKEHNPNYKYVRAQKKRNAQRFFEEKKRAQAIFDPATLYNQIINAYIFQQKSKTEETQCQTHYQNFDQENNIINFSNDLYSY